MVQTSISSLTQREVRESAGPGHPPALLQSCLLPGLRRGGPQDALCMCGCSVHSVHVCVCVWLVAFASEITGTEAQAGLMPSLKIRLVTPSYQQGGDVHRLSTSEPISTFK